MCKNHNAPGYRLAEGDAGYGEAFMTPSAANQCEFPVLVFRPRGGARDRWPIVYQLHGSNGQPLTEKGLRTLYHPDTGMQEAADFFQVIFVCVMVGRTMYLDAPNDPKVRIASYIGEELVAWGDEHLPSIPDREHRFLAGFSMGGGGAVSLLCRYPDTFSVALSRGGALDPAAGVRDLDWDDVWPSAARLLGDYWGPDRKNYHQNCCMNLINHIQERDDCGIVLEVGIRDFLYKTNRRFHERLRELRFDHIYAEYPGGHQWGREMLFSLMTHLQYFRTTR